MSTEIYNRIEFVGEQSVIDRLLDAIRGDDEPLGGIDFEKIIPTPEALKKTVGMSFIEKIAILAYLKAACPDTDDYGVEKLDADTYREIIDELSSRHPKDYSEQKIMEYNLDGTKDADYVEAGKIYLDNELNYGASSCVKWCYINWGAKWCYYTFPLKNNTISFVTANGLPTNVVFRLSEMYPDIRLNWCWYKYGVGKMSVQNGIVISVHMPETETQEADEMEAEIIKSDPWAGEQQDGKTDEADDDE